MIPMHRKARPCPLPSRKPHLLQAVFRGTSSSGRAGAAAQTGAGAFFGRSLKKHGQTDGFPSASLHLPVWGQSGGALRSPPVQQSRRSLRSPLPQSSGAGNGARAPQGPGPPQSAGPFGLRRRGTLPRRRGRFPPSPPCAGACPWPAQSGSAPAQGYAPGNRF